MPLTPNPSALGRAFPDTDLEVVVEAAFGANVEDPASWVWTDLSTRLLSKQITASRGSSSGASESAAEAATLVLANEDGALTPTHPMSPYWPHIARNVPVRVLLHPGHGDCIETFTRAGAQTDWSGASESGHTWGLFGTGVGATGITGGAGTQTSNQANMWQLHYTGWAENVELRATASVNKLAAGGSIQPSLVLRYTRTTSFAPYYLVRYSISPTDQRVTILIDYHHGANAATTVASVLTSVTHAVGTPLQLRARIVGPHIQAKVWQGSNEPGWQLATFHTGIAGPGFFGLRSQLSSGATNAPVTVSWDDFGAVALYVGAAGYAASWQPTYLPERQGKSWSQVTLTVSGVRRRLARRDSPFYSPIRRTSLIYAQRGQLLAYWPLEDGSDSKTASNAVDDRRPMRPQGVLPAFASYDPPPPNGNTRRWGTAPIASFAEGGRLIGQVPLGSGSPVRWAVRCLTACSAAGAGATLRLFAVELIGGTISKIEVLALIGGGINVVPYDLSGTAMTGYVTGDTFTGLAQLQVDAVQNGADIDVRLWNGTVALPYSWSHTFTGQTLGRVRQVVINPYQQTTTSASTDAGRAFAVGHMQVWNSNDVGVDADKVVDATTGATAYVWEAWAGESAEGRMRRLCAAESVPIVTWSAGDPRTATRLGAQDDEPLLDSISDAATADGGLLYERNFTLAYRARSARYNQAPSMVVDLAGYRVAGGERDDVLVPVFDDQDLRNDQEFTRPGGSAGRFSDEQHVAANGRYADSTAINVQFDAQLLDQAAWAVHVGTVEEMRQPQLKVDLAANPDLVGQWMATDIGSVVRRTNAPPEFPPGDVDQVVEGYAETFGPRLWKVTANTVPASPWRVAVTGDNELGRADTSASALAAPVTVSVTTLSVTTAAGPRWTTDPAQFPFDVNVGGERVAVTAISGTGATQTFTVVRAVNGVQKAHGATTAVRHWHEATAAL